MSKLAELIVDKYEKYYEEWDDYLKSYGMDSDSGEFLEQTFREVYLTACKELEKEPKEF